MPSIQLFSLFFLSALLYGTTAEPLSTVYIGYDANTTSIIVDDMYEKFMVYIDTTIPFLLDMDDFSAVQAAMVDMDILFLCPSLEQMDRSLPMQNLMNSFVSGGGIIIYSAFELDMRAGDVSTWLNDPRINVGSGETYFSLYNYFGIDKKGGSFYENDNLIAKSTNESLATTFSRIVYDRWGSPYKTFADPLYWVPYNTRHMYLTPQNQPFCMFQRNGFLSEAVPQENHCWVFNFPHGQGNVIEISADFSDGRAPDRGVSDFLGILRAAVGLRFEADLFPPKERDVILAKNLGNQWQNIMYDLATDSNVFVFRDREIDDDDTDEFGRLLELTNANSFVTNKFVMDYNVLFTKDINNDYAVRFGPDYANFVRSGGDMVYIGDGDLYLDKFIFNYLYDFGLFDISQNPSSQEYHFPQNINEQASAFANIENLPSRRVESFLNNLSGSEEYCRFYTIGAGCNVWSAPFDSGHFTVHTWDWRSGITDYRYYPQGEYGRYANRFDPSGGRLLHSWPNTAWREALIASLDPDGSPPENIVPAMDFEYLEVESPLNVIVLQNGLSQLYFANANVIRFLNASTHNVFDWNSYDPDQLFDLLYNYPEVEMDAIVIPNIYYSAPNIIDTKNNFEAEGIAQKSEISQRGCCVKKNLDGSIDPRGGCGPCSPPFDSTTQIMLRNFVNNGGNLVTLGSGNTDFLYNVFYQYVQQTNTFNEYYNIFSHEYAMPYGMNFEAKYLPESLFTPYYTPGEVLPFLGPEYMHNSIEDFYYGLDYCAYTFPFARTVFGGFGEFGSYGQDYEKYCAVWSRQYGEGHLSALSDNFNSPLYNNRPVLVESNPWARVLNIALGANPNGPSATPTITPTTTTTPTITATPSPTSSDTPSRTPAPVLVSPSNTPTPTTSFSSTASESKSNSETPSGSRSVSPVRSPSLPPLSPLPSPPPSLSVGASQSPVRSAPATKTRSVAPSVDIAPSVRPSSGIIPSSAGDCTDCDIGEAQVALNSNEGEGEKQTQEVPLVNDLGDPVGNIIVPPNLGPDGGGLLDVVFVSNVPRTTQVNLGSVILDITLTDSFGNLITELNEPLEICIEGDESDDACLSFFNTRTGEWECEDECLETVGSQVCGKTDHLTSFALLLDGGGGGGGDDDPCNSNDPDYLFVWLSLAAVACAICLVIISVVVIEIRFRKRLRDRGVSFKRMSSRVTQHM